MLVNEDFCLYFESTVAELLMCRGTLVGIFLECVEAFTHCFLLHLTFGLHTLMFYPSCKLLSVDVSRKITFSCAICANGLSVR